VGDPGNGQFAVCDDGSCRIGPVPQFVWDFEISGYPVLQKWLAHRQGQPVNAALLANLRDLIGRIAEIDKLMKEADAILEQALAAPLTKTSLKV
jgi:hypothetical protein